MTHDKNNIVDLFDRRQETKEQALERLFNEHGATLRKFLCGRVRNAAEAEDLVQEVFVRLARLENLERRLDKDRGDIRSFIYTTANNLVVDHERRNAVRRHYQQSQQGSAREMVVEITPEVILVANQELNVLKQAIMDLPPNWRKAFTLSRFKHMSYKEIASEMGLSVKVIEKYISRALSVLRNATRSEPDSRGEQ